jgi:hypothetical protein
MDGGDLVDIETPCRSETCKAVALHAAGECAKAKAAVDSATELAIRFSTRSAAVTTRRVRIMRALRRSQWVSARDLLSEASGLKWDSPHWNAWQQLLARIKRDGLAISRGIRGQFDYAITDKGRDFLARHR